MTQPAEALLTAAWCRLHVHTRFAIAIRGADSVGHAAGVQTLACSAVIR